MDLSNETQFQYQLIALKNQEMLVEPVILLMEYLNLSYTVEFCTETEWNTKHKAVTPFGMSPVLVEQDGKKIVRIKNICRYLACVWSADELWGKNSHENLQIDIIVDTIEDMRQDLAMYYYEPLPGVKAGLRDFIYKNFNYYINKLNDMAGAKSFLIDKLSWADIFFYGLYPLLNEMLGKDIVHSQWNQPFTTIFKNVHNLPSIKEYFIKNHHRHSALTSAAIY
uniref:glutathione transferase n=1 Tax=Homalodisca liturata TaxID=320908 RepID=A0A1B6IHU4_9HEMI